MFNLDKHFSNASSSEKLRVKKIFLQHMCQKDFSLKTSGIRGELFYLEIRITPLFRSEFYTVMLECADISKRVNWTRWEIGGEIKKIKNAQKNVHLCIFFCALDETFEKCSILLKVKEGENFNHPGTICRTYGAGRYTLSISRINPPKFGGGLKFESDGEIGQKGAF